MNNRVDKNVCSNCKNKISNNNLFCSYCGNILSNNLFVDNDIGIVNFKDDNIDINDYNVINDEEIKNKYDGEIVDKNEIKKEKKSGIFLSTCSFILFVFFFLPYLIFIVIRPIVDSLKGEELGMYPIGVIMFGGLVFLPTVVSFILGIVSVKKYRGFAGSKGIIRKMFNILNIISLVIVGLFACLCILFFLLIVIAPLWLM